jgi:dephospho-CoA kinase
MDKLIEMLLKKNKDEQIYISGIEEIIKKFGKDAWENEFDTFRKQLRKWMYDDEAHTELPKYIINEYEFVVSNY